MMTTRRYLMVLLLFLSHWIIAQTPPFTRGVNLTGWFQTGTPTEIQFTQYTKHDFEQIQSLGCDVIRLPINLHYMTSGAPDYTLDPLFLSFLDQVVQWAADLKMYLILDNHSFDPSVNTETSVGPVLQKVWAQMAEHYVSASDYILYEVLNEPHGISDEDWNAIQKQVIQTIRSKDTKHWIVVGGAGWNSYWNLDAIPDLGDDKLIYTFHFYDPFLFTHQGATWVDPSMAPLAGVPFPYDANKMPSLPASLQGSWVNNNYNSYPQDGTVAAVKELLDKAVAFHDQRQVPIFCGEFGVFIPNSNNDDRVYWYDAVRSYLEANDIAWTSWDYHYGFGLFKEGGNDLFDHDLNVELLQALGLNVPPQSPLVIRPDSIGFPLYTDFIGPHIVNGGYGGQQNFYAQGAIQTGDYALTWQDAQLYSALGFDFVPNKDLSLLAGNGYALDFYYQCTQPDFTYIVRFVDTDEGENDLPWRNIYEISPNDWPVENGWYHVHIPLSDFYEQGAWDGEWHNPIGAFDWTSIDRFEIVTDIEPLNQGVMTVDQLQVNNDQATSANVVFSLPLEVRVTPNPFANQIRIHTPGDDLLSFQIWDLSGKLWLEKKNTNQRQIDVSNLPAGNYLIQITDGVRWNMVKMQKV
ncbi:MAG: cellulase family glycosylhydrolase [Saprospiraceae bacterium]|nr:cellulase family glycosylhydrolase [Saprospiraceae bacterium]